MKEEPLGSELREKLAAWRIEADLPHDFQQRVWKRIAMRRAADSDPPWLRWLRSRLTSATRLSVPRLPLTAVVARFSRSQVIASVLAPNPMIQLARAKWIGFTHVMKRIAPPIIGGVITSAILNLLIYPVIYVIWRKRELPSGGAIERGLPVVTDRRRVMTSKWLLRFLFVSAPAAALFFGGCTAWNWWSSRSQSSSRVPGEPFVTRTAGQLFISLYGDLHNAQSEVIVRFRDSNGQLKDVGEVKTGLSMNLPGGIVMHSRIDVSKTSTAGIYRAKLQPQMAGDWVVNLSWKGAAGEGQVEMPVTVEQ